MFCRNSLAASWIVSNESIFIFIYVFYKLLTINY
ncbi:Uncharacterised protein [Segatella copri]|nr:Uncharacterised protein [Segatella copri]